MRFIITGSYKQMSTLVFTKMNAFSFFSLVLFVCFAGNVAKRLPFPKQFKRCRKTDPRLDACVRDAIEKALPYLIKGMPTYGINPVDPLIAKSITLRQDFGPIPLNATFHQLVSRGNRHSIVKAAHVEVDNYLLSSSSYTPEITLSGNYHLHAKIFRFPLEGSGGYNITLTGVTTNITLLGAPEQRDNATFMKIVKTIVKMDVEDIKFDFRNLFNPDGRIGQNINWFLNRLSMRIFQETRPLIEETQSKLACMLAERFFKLVPYSEFYL